MFELTVVNKNGFLGKSNNLLLLPNTTRTLETTMSFLPPETGYAQSL